MFQTEIYNVFNVNETGITICQKPQKIGKKGKSEKVCCHSDQKGKTVLIFCCVSGTGMFVPPVMIFPCVRMMPHKVPNGTVGVATKLGWVNEESFSLQKGTKPL